MTLSALHGLYGTEWKDDYECQTTKDVEQSHLKRFILIFGQGTS
jgi:hypothetical protein